MMISTTPSRGSLRNAPLTAAFYTEKQRSKETDNHIVAKE